MQKTLLSLCLYLVTASAVYSAGYDVIQKTSNRLKKQLKGVNTPTKKKTPAKPDKKVKKIFIPEVQLDEMEDYVDDKNVRIIDARFGKHDDRTRIPGAKSFKGKYSRTYIRKFLPDKNQTIIIYCQNSDSPISLSFAKHLAKMGYTDVKVFKAGIDGWKSAGNKIRKLKKRRKKSSQ